MREETVEVILFLLEPAYSPDCRTIYTLTNVFNMPILTAYRTMWAFHWAVIPNVTNVADEIHMLLNKALQDALMTADF